MSELKWLSYPQMIIMDAVKLIHKINTNNRPKSLCKFMNFSEVRQDLNRIVRTPKVRYIPNLEKINTLQLYRGTYYYGRIPLDIKLILKNKLFNTRLKAHIIHNYNVHRMDKPVT